MPVIALVSAKSCGVTVSALALALASSRPSVLAECDPAGGTVRAGYLQNSVDGGFGLYHLAAAERVGPDALANAVASSLWPMDAAGHRKLLPGLTDPTQAPALERTWPALADILHVLAEDAGYNVFVDGGRLAFGAGRLHPVLSPAPLLHRADLVLLVVRGTTQSLALARNVIDPLRAEFDESASTTSLGLLLLEEGEFPAHQVSTALRTPVLAALPWDPDTAGYLTRGGKPPRGYERSPLLRHARSAAEQLEAVAQRRRVQQEWPARRSYPQLAGVVQRLAQTSRGGRRG
ncbi:hypothetical protein GCM10010329_81230 [Streptomyces spiroverticillatus]|uniref:Cellulose biosynthesis protein BcsQ n=1 Tax=Streptomyces finlayi TaxID=67296 RepID=A0A919CFN4_9ACTN|nr:hypothetical protein [Streptomyces finlayi]GHA46421.1 hypothetical protein GCM10010329_81230 [Streptomyces spiroverticillatus]GHD16296.1 hypothetical protein GCM10010334_77270 [Streptomyces finlayi]